MAWLPFQHAPAFPARYDGECAGCGGDIEEGEQIIVTDDGAAHAACVDHTDCPEGSTCGDE